MKIKYRLVAAFVLLSILLLVAICIFIYTYAVAQQERDFLKRLENRALTVGGMLFKLPSTNYQLLSKVDSATFNLLSFENINVYNNRNQRIYRFARNFEDTISIQAELLNEVRSKGKINMHIKDRTLLAIYYQKAEVPAVIVISAIDEHGKDNLKSLQQSLLLALAVGILLSFLIGWLFSIQLLKPILKISATVNNISAHNIEKRLPVSKVNDEWNELMLTFNNLLTRLEQSFDLQGRFISNASHELSTPLTSVSNQIDVTLQKSRSNEEYVAVFQSIQADVNHMTALTQHLLDIARTSRGGSIQTKPVRIDEILMELPALIKKINPSYKVHIFFDELPEDEKQITVNGNNDLLLAAFKNLGENGCKYAADGEVNISLSFLSNKILVLFSNSYESFDPNELESIFQPFQRGSFSNKIKGHGLGLSLTRRIILLHGGEIKAEIPDKEKILISVTLPCA